MKNLTLLMYIAVSVVLLCSIQDARSYLQHLTSSRLPSASPPFAVSTQKPARSYQVDTIINQDLSTSSFSNLQNLKKAKGMGDANQLPELEKLSEADLLNKSPSMDAMSRYVIGLMPAFCMYFRFIPVMPIITNTYLLFTIYV